MTAERGTVLPPIRVSAEERARLVARARELGVTLSDLVRMGVGLPPVRDAGPVAVPLTLTETAEGWRAVADVLGCEGRAEATFRDVAIGHALVDLGRQVLEDHAVGL